LVETGGKDTLAEIQPLGAGALATIDMPREHYDGFYEGFANSVLWPAFHSRADLIRAKIEDYGSYRAINAFMARALLRFCKPDTSIWVHDYHYLTLGADLRTRGVEDPIGFFLHTPFPGVGVMTSVPHHRELVDAMLAYDLIGFQTDTDLANFRDYLIRELEIDVARDGRIANARNTRLAVFPIGIDVRTFAERATKAAAHPEIARLRASLQGRRLAIGINRLDYSKGLPSRLRAFERMFEINPDLKKNVSLLQIAVPTRVHIQAYRQLKDELAGVIGEINGRLSEIDWTPIRYLNKSFPQSMLAGFYRSANMGLVTPFNDGMNLVAKEYVAAQNPLDPGVLVLSEFAGAARQLDAALLVNPHDIDAMARVFVTALSMPLAERRERWQSMIHCLEDSALDSWFDDFVTALNNRPKSRRVGSLGVTVALPTGGRAMGKALNF
jgi:trehalose 6-phosphate synthase